MRATLRLYYAPAVAALALSPVALMSAPVFRGGWVLALAAVSIPGYRRAAHIAATAEPGETRLSGWTRAWIGLSLLLAFASSCFVAFVSLASFPRGELWAWWKLLPEVLFAAPACTTAVLAASLWTRVEVMPRTWKHVVITAACALAASAAAASWPRLDRYFTAVQCVERGNCWDTVESRCRDDLARCPEPRSLHQEVP